MPCAACTKELIWSSMCLEALKSGKAASLAVWIDANPEGKDPLVVLMVGVLVLVGEVVRH